MEEKEGEVRTQERAHATYTLKHAAHTLARTFTCRQTDRHNTTTGKNRRQTGRTDATLQQLRKTADRQTTEDRQTDRRTDTTLQQHTSETKVINLFYMMAP